MCAPATTSRWACRWASARARRTSRATAAATRCRTSPARRSRIYNNGGGYVGGFASFGQSNFKDIERRIQIGPALRIESGKADGSHLGGGVEGGWWFNLGQALKTGPFAHVEWQTIKVNGYTENGNDSTAMYFGRQQRDALISELGWRLQGQWKVGELAMAPYVELAWNHDSKADPRNVTRRPEQHGRHASRSAATRRTRPGAVPTSACRRS